MEIRSALGTRYKMAMTHSVPDNCKNLNKTQEKLEIRPRLSEGVEKKAASISE